MTVLDRDSDLGCYTGEFDVRYNTRSLTDGERTGEIVNCPQEQLRNIWTFPNYSAIKIS